MKLVLVLVLLSPGQSICKTDCNTKLYNKVISFESTKYIGLQLYPYTKRSGGKIFPWLGTIHGDDTPDSPTVCHHLWKAGEYKNYLTLGTLKPGWENYYIQVDTTMFGTMGGNDNLAYWSDILSSDPGWNVQFDVVCDDCDQLTQCHVVNKWKNSKQDEDYGRLAADGEGSAGFVYGREDYDNVQWTVHIHPTAPVCPELEGEEGFSWGWLILTLVCLLCVCVPCYLKCK